MNSNLISNFSSYIPGSDAYITEAASNHEAETKKTESLVKTIRNAQTGDSDAELLNACKEFESYFIQMMFKEMRKTVVENDNSIFKKSMAERTFQEMFDEQVAASSANGGGIGLAAFMYKQMKRENGSIGV